MSNKRRDELADISAAMASHDFKAEIETLIKGSIRKMRPTAATMKLYRRVSWHGRAATARAWLKVITLINVLVIGIDYMMAASMLAPAIALRGLAIPLVYLAVVKAWTTERPAWIEGLSIILFSLSMMMLACMLGLVAGGPIHERYATACFMVISTSIAVIPLGRRWIILSGLCNCLAYAGVQWLNPSVSGFDVGLMTAFFAAVTSALILARLTANRVHLRAEMLRLHDLFQMRQLRAANRQLQELAITDALTGILNRRAIMERFQASFDDPARACRLAVALVDIDHFKRLNDTRGHQEGDRCLRAVATSLAASATAWRGEVGRYGGEEFLLLLPDADIDRARVACEQMRQTVQTMNLPSSLAGDAGPVTVSIGVAAISTGPHSPTMMSELLRAADEALYAAKRGGRNRVQLSGGRDELQGVAGANLSPRALHRVA
ncbi:GGDEF domain-containing protein [Methylobacterium radiodurans]|uniref:diguanylate cyclase n=1 Tax=Methylobacterium radiodurans TaxID=2202828 RepID=A0A2U8VQC9_9HYPH|nr:diguanylate cyclase [Methylobacterium radiodurans]AWN35863.1 hypothetical protein DK427_09000 [Methylobacterium radiodurans]